MLIVKWGFVSKLLMREVTVIFYHLYIAIGTICLESDLNTIKHFDEKPFSTEKYEQ